MSASHRWDLLAVCILGFLVCLLHWGAYLLIASDTLPAHVDAATVLQGSIADEKARTQGAMECCGTV